MIIRSFCLILFLNVFLLFISSGAKAEAPNSYHQYFREEMNSLSTVDFRIEKGWAKFDLIGGFADGKYKLKTWKIRPFGQNVYVLYLFFQKKSGTFLRFNQEVKIPFFYQKRDCLVFATPKGKKTFNLKELDILHVIKTQNGYKIIHKSQRLEVELPVTNGKVYLTFIFP